MTKSNPALHVSINMAASADGKISTYRREEVALGSREDRRLMDILRARSDAVIVGARTVQLDGWAIRVRDAAIRQRRARSGGSPHPLNVVFSSRLDLPAKCQFFTHPKTEKLVVTTKAAPVSRLRRFEKLADVWVMPAKRIQPLRVLERLAGRGIRRILVEGGGELNFSFFKHGCVDEVYVTLTPQVIGGGEAPTMVDGRGFLWDTHVPLQLVSCRRRGDEVFLRYRVVKR